MLRYTLAGKGARLGLLLHHDDAEREFAYDREFRLSLLVVALDKAGNTVNNNAIPFDQNPPMVASGIRLGTPAVTTRGMREAEMDVIAEYISRVLAAPEDDRVLTTVRSEVKQLCKKFPLYPERLA